MMKTIPLLAFLLWCAASDIVKGRHPGLRGGTDDRIPASGDRAPPQAETDPEVGRALLLRPGKKIIGGSDVSASEAYPWFGAMLTRRAPGMGPYEWGGCGGTLIAPGWVLTAAHCVGSTDPGRYKWEVGAYCDRSSIGNNCGLGSDFIAVDGMHVHPDYDGGDRSHDLALMRLEEALSREYITPDRPQDDVNLHGGDPLMAIGMGRTSNSGGFKNILQHTVVNYVTNSDCREWYAVLGAAVTDDMLCAYEPGTDTCNGDSGGPVIFDRDGVITLVGAVSWGTRNCAGGYPGVSSRVGSHYDWIEEKVCQDAGPLSKPDWCPGSTGTSSTASSAAQGGASTPTTTAITTTTTTSSTNAASTEMLCAEERDRSFLLSYRPKTCHSLATKHTRIIRSRICNNVKEARQKCPYTCNDRC